MGGKLGLARRFAGRAFSRFLVCLLCRFPSPSRLLGSLALRDADLPSGGNGSPRRLALGECRIVHPGAMPLQCFSLRGGGGLLSIG
jgi:hypothetical protein